MPHGMWDLSSPTRDQTHTPGIGGQSLNHWTTREVLASACRGFHRTIVGHLPLEDLVEAMYPPSRKVISHTLLKLISESLKVQKCTHVNLVSRSQVKNVRAWCRSAVSNSLQPQAMDCSSPGSSVHGESPGKNTGVGCHFLLQGIFLTQGLNLCLD